MELLKILHLKCAHISLVSTISLAGILLNVVGLCIFRLFISIVMSSM